MKIKGNPHGFSVIEALIAMAVLSFGMVSLMTIFAQVTRSSMDDELMAVASRLASQKIEEVLATKAAGGTSGYSNISTGTVADNVTYDSMPYTRTTDIYWVAANGNFQTVSQSDTGLKRIDVTVSWDNGSSQSLRLSSLISSY